MISCVMFNDKLCSIYSISYSKVWWVSKRSKVILYSDISCNFERSKQRLSQLDIAKNVDLPVYDVVLGIEYNLVRENQVIVLTDPILGSMGEYIITTVNASNSVWWWVSCISLQVTTQKWG